MPQGSTRAGGLSVTSSDAGGDPVDLQRMLSITVAIEPHELASADADYSRSVTHNYEPLPELGNVTHPGRPGSVSGDGPGWRPKPVCAHCRPAVRSSPSQKRKGTGLQENGSPVSGTRFVYS